MKLIFLGAPGTGKGTQAEIISKHYSVPTISTGNIIRDALKRGTELGIKAKELIDAGKLVPDDVVIGIIRERLAKDDCVDGFILDGFPRTIAQAEALERMNIDIDFVIKVDVKDEELVKRVSGRRVCENCGASYHIEVKRPKVDNKCDSCNGTLVQRKDDQPEIVRERLRVYHKETEPLEVYFKSKGKLSVIDASNSISQVTKDIIDIIEGKK